MKKRNHVLAMEELIAYLLLSGVLLSAACIAIGVIWARLQGGHAILESPLSGNNVWHFWLQTAHVLTSHQLTPALWVNCGIALLLLTPYLRVAASLVYFAFAEHNFKFVFCTGFVFTILTCSLFFH